MNLFYRDVKMVSIIIEGTFVNHDAIFLGQIEIDKESGLISRIGRTRALGTPDLVFGRGQLIFPGMVDVHVHAQEDETGKQNHKETYLTASDAAINGGVVACAAMPNTTSPLVTLERLLWHKDKHKDLPVTFLNYAGIGPQTNPLLANVPYKVYVGPSVGDLFFKSPDQMAFPLKDYFGKCVSFHVEDYDVLMANKGRIRTVPEGRWNV